jgi:hypothetical protein
MDSVCKLSLRALRMLSWRLSLWQGNAPVLNYEVKNLENVQGDECEELVPYDPNDKQL